MNNPLINRDSLKTAMKGRMHYSEIAQLMGISKTALGFKIIGRKGRGIMPFTEEEVQILRSLFGDVVLEPAPKFEAPKKGIKR